MENNPLPGTLMKAVTVPPTGGGKSTAGRFALAGLAVLLGTGPGAAHSLVLAVPTWVLAPNTPDQPVQLYVENRGAPCELLGVSLNLQVADGGPLAGGVGLGPAIRSVDILSGGHLFADNHNGISGGLSLTPQIYEAGTLTSHDTVTLPTGETWLGTVIFDTSGFLGPARWTVTLDTRNDRTRFLDGGAGELYPVLFDGQILVVPEPVEAPVLAAALLALGAGWRSWPRRGWNAVPGPGRRPPDRGPGR